MSIKQPKISNPKLIGDEVSELFLSAEMLPFKSVKKIRTGMTYGIYDCASVTFQDGQNRIVTGYDDLRVFNFEENRYEKIIEYPHTIFSVHFYKEEEVLMTTDNNGELSIFKLFPEIKIIKKLKVSQPNSILWRITQISENNFFCCVSCGNSHGCLYKIKFNKNKNNWISEEIEYPTLGNNEKEEIRCIYQSINHKNIILFAGGNTMLEEGEDYSIKSIDLNNDNNKFKRFPKNHVDAINCLTSYINTKNNEEIFLSGSDDQKIMFWSLKGENLKEMEFDGCVDCFLNDFSRNTIFIAGGFVGDRSIYSYSTMDIETEKLEKKLEKLCEFFVFGLRWVNGYKNDAIVICSPDRKLCILKLDHDFVDIRKTYNCLQKMSDCQIKFKNKSINFWNLFVMKTEKENKFQEFKEMNTSIDQETVLSIIVGNEIEISYDKLSDYYFFFRIMDLKHCIAVILKKIKKMEKLEDIYFLFKEFCLKHENEVIKSWFFADAQEVEKILPSLFETSFALSLFNRMKELKIENKLVIEIIMKDVYFGHVWAHLEKYELSEMIKIYAHEDFKGVGSRELKIGYYYKSLYENLNDNFNLTLVSTDKKEFKVHKEILILRFDFFFRLFNFGGLEVTEFKETGKITLTDLMSSDVVECLISYAYLGELEVKEKGISTITTFCKLLIFCDQWNEKQLMEKVKKEFKSYVNNNAKSKNDKKKIKSEIQLILKSMSGLSRIWGKNKWCE